MTPTTSRTHRLAAAGLVTALTVAALTGCAQEEPTQDELTSSATDTAPTTSAAEDVVTTSGPDDTEATTAEAEESTTQTAEPAALEASDGSFEIEIPAQWEDAIDLLDEDGVLVAAKDTERVDDFYTNVVVTTEESVKNLSAAVEDAAKDLAGEDGDYELLDPVDVDGEEAPGYTLVREVEDAKVHQTQRWMNHDKKLYVITFSAVDSQAEDALPILEEILASWTWSD